MTDSKELEVGIEEVLKNMDKSKRKKYRAVLYYLLVEKFKKESIYRK